MSNVKTVKKLALSQEVGRRRNNKVRRSNGEKVARPKAYYFAAFSGGDIKTLEDGGTVTKTYNSGKVESYVVG